MNTKIDLTYIKAINEASALRQREQKALAYSKACRIKKIKRTFADVLKAALVIVIVVCTIGMLGTMEIQDTAYANTYIEGGR